MRRDVGPGQLQAGIHLIHHLNLPPLFCFLWPYRRKYFILFFHRPKGATPEGKMPLSRRHRVNWRARYKQILYRSYTGKSPFPNYEENFQFPSETRPGTAKSPEIFVILRQISRQKKPGKIFLQEIFPVFLSAIINIKNTVQATIFSYPPAFGSTLSGCQLYFY